MLKVGLTGSIAVGKSTVCRYFAELGCHTLDADKTARDVVVPGTEGLARLAESFGPHIISADGSLDRAALAKIVFADVEKRSLLNSIVHPLVLREQDAWLNQVEANDPNAIAVVDAALMIESGGYKRFNKLIVVWCNADIQLARLIERNGLSEADARKRIDAQMPQEEKKRYADLLIDTSDGFESTRKQTIDVFEQLKKVYL